MKLVVGMGNPGPEYVGTRHNVGFEVIDELCDRLGLAGKGQFERVSRAKFDALTLEFSIRVCDADEKVMLMKPMTFMNVSGRAVQQAMSFYQLAPEQILIVLDDVALPCGRLRLRAEGSSGGHNGLKSIESSIGTDQYPRLRIGVDAPPEFVPQRDYVLGRFSPAQRQHVEQAIPRACGAIIAWMEKGILAAMSQFNAADNG
jgi:PTH1 family peptidyl-tRNA hydrolase